MARTKKEPEADPSWRKDAACYSAGGETDLFFPVGTTGPAIEQIANAKAVCQSCIAKLACLEYALQNNIQDGIWGGTTEEERRAILKKRRAAS